MPGPSGVHPNRRPDKSTHVARVGAYAIGLSLEPHWLFGAVILDAGTSPSSRACFGLAAEPTLAPAGVNVGIDVVALAGDVVDALAAVDADIALDVATARSHSSYGVQRQASIGKAIDTREAHYGRSAQGNR